MLPGQPIGRHQLKVTRCLENGLFGRRFCATDGEAQEFVVEMVTVESEAQYALCHNAISFKGLFNQASIANVIDAGWTTSGDYFQVIDLNPQSYRPFVAPSANLAQVDLWDVFSEIVSAVSYLHRREVVHGAIAPSVIYAFEGAIKVGELWWLHSTCGGLSSAELRLAIEGTLPVNILDFAAPEVLSGASPTRAADIFSVGTIMYFLAHGQMPYARNLDNTLVGSKRQIIESLKSTRQKLDDVFINMVTAMLAPNADNRLTVPTLEAVISEQDRWHERP